MTKQRAEKPMKYHFRFIQGILTFLNSCMVSPQAKFDTRQKSKFRQIDNFLIWTCWSRKSKMAREKKIAANRLARRPAVNVTAKPRIGPVPNWYRNAAEIRVVMLESKT